MWWPSLVPILVSLGHELSGRLAGEEVGKLYERYSDGYGAMVVAYHYAWLLDALGAKDEAAQVFGRISSGEIGKIGGQACNVEIEKTIREYAKIKYAIMLGETCDYREALRVLSGVVASGEETHISKLTESVRESIQILKREGPKDENEQR